MDWWEAVLFGVVEGITEFLPISSTGHLTVLEALLGYATDDPEITAFTAIIQVGAIAATLVFLRDDVARLVSAWVRGLRDPTERDAGDYRFAWAVIVGSIPIVIVAIVFRHQIETTLRSLWFVAWALILWSGVMYYADSRATLERHESDVTWIDTLIIGIVQCVALIPGVSRSGATMSAGLLRGIDRVAVTRLSFFLAIPALTGAAIFEGIGEFSAISSGVGWGPTIVATVVSFVVAFVAIAWLLRYIAHHNFSIFIAYRVGLGLLVLLLLATGAVSPT
jgi:undecaprenyl-diphosphatase